MPIRVRRVTAEPWLVSHQAPAGDRLSPFGANTEAATKGETEGQHAMLRSGRSPGRRKSGPGSHCGKLGPQGSSKPVKVFPTARYLNPTNGGGGRRCSGIARSPFRILETLGRVSFDELGSAGSCSVEDELGDAATGGDRI